MNSIFKLKKALVNPLILSLIILSFSLTFLIALEFNLLEMAKTANEFPTDGSSSISIVQLYQDAKYAWDRLQLRKDFYGANQTGFFFSTEVIKNVNFSTTNNLGYLPIYYAMYKITNDSSYLTLAREMFNNVLKFTSAQLNLADTIYDVICTYDWKNDVIVDDTFSPVGLFIPIALEDPYYIPFFEDLISDSYEIFWSPENLIYPSRNKDGEITGTNCHLTWSPSITGRINQLLWMAEITGDIKYKNWADKTIEKVWSYNLGNGLLPRSINAITGSVLDSSVSHYDMTGWLCTLELAYILNDWNNSAGTGVHTYFELISKTAQAMCDYIWHPDQWWVYKVSSVSGGISMGIPEMNSIYVDYAMILAYEITNNEEFLNKAIIDFENEFLGSDPIKPDGILMSNSLVIHSPNTFTTQSQFSGSSNIMVARTASLLYQYTQNEIFLTKSKFHYNQLMQTHRFSKGYTNMLDTITLQPYPNYNGYPARVFDLAPIEAILALPSSFILSEDVIIDWGYGLHTTLPAEYGTGGAFTGISINIQERRVHLKSVSSKINGSLFIHFDDDSTIESVILDGNIPYYSFTENLITCEEGTHAYTITFTKQPDTTYTTSSVSFPTSPTSSSHYTSTTSSSNDASNSYTSTTSSIFSSNTFSSQNTGFSNYFFGMILITLVIIFFFKKEFIK